MNDTKTANGFHSYKKDDENHWSANGSSDSSNGITNEHSIGYTNGYGQNGHTNGYEHQNGISNGKR